MDIEELKEFIESKLEETLSPLKQEISRLEGKVEEKISETLKTVDAKNSGLASSVKKESKKVEESANLTLKSLQTELETLKGQLAEKETAVKRSARDNTIRQVFERNNVTLPDAAAKLFLTDADPYLAEEEGIWYFRRGEDVVKLEDAVSNFLETPEGKIFKQTPQRGLGVKAPQRVANPPKEASLNELLFSEE